MNKLLKCMLALLIMVSVLPVSKIPIMQTIQAAENELENVALKGTVEVSAVTTDNGATKGGGKINDGIISTSSYWDSGTSVENPWIILDLKETYDIQEIKIFNYWGKVWQQPYDRYYKYKIYASNDKAEWVPLAENLSENATTAEGDSYKMAKNTKYRYVKVEYHGSNNNEANLAHLVELQVFADTNDVDTPSEPEEANIALNKSVVAANGQTSYITDGDTGRGKFWDGGEGPQAFVIDLQGYYDVKSFHAFPYFDNSRYYHYEISVSDNGFNYTKVAEKSTKEPETAAGTEFKLAEEDQKIARYVKVTMFENSANASVHMCEFQVFGSKVENYEPEAPKDPTDSANIAFGKKTTANAGVAVSDWIVDGDVDTNWNAFVYPAALDIDLEKTYDLSDIQLYFPVVENRYYYYSVYTSLDGNNFDRVYEKRSKDIATAEGTKFDLTEDMAGKKARYIRVSVDFVSQGASAYLSEVRVHGTEDPTTESIDRTGFEIPDYKDSDYATPITKQDTLNEVNNMVGRLLGEAYKNWFTFDLVNEDSKTDFFEITNENDKIAIKGNKGVSLTSGLYHYLKTYCNVHISQQTMQVSALPEKPTPVIGTVRKDTPFEVRYAYNYCTLSYTSAFYGEDEWQREIDWLALNGVNLVLDTTGQEAVWVAFLQNLGYTSEEAKSWLVGPGYTAWQLMSNMENYGGPINDQYVLDRLELARKNQRKMKVLGMNPVIQGYAGMIPSDYDDVIAKKDEATQEQFKQFVDAMMPQGSWGGQFNRPDMLKTNTKAFNAAAKLFYEAQESVLGDVSSYYAVDPFHEGGIRPSDMSEFEISKTVLGEMMDHDQDAVWVIQSWEGNPTKALLEGLENHKDDHALILDLTSTTDPHYNNSKWGDEFYQTPWIYCMLDNFGDRPGVHGDLKVVAEQVSDAYKSSNKMKGIGITPEGTKLNPINYELFFSTIWQENQDPINLNDWVKDYVTQRYGEFSESSYKGWMMLIDTAYSSSGGHWGSANAIINSRPGKNPILGSFSIPYEQRLFVEAVELIFKDYDKFCSQETYQYDLVTLLRQILQNSQLTYYNNMNKAFQNKNLELFDKNAQNLLDTISLMDAISATEKDELLGNWIGLANDRSADYDDFTKDMFEFNAKALITTWGGRNSAKSLGDYAYRQYSGLLNDYIKPRWEKHIGNMRDSLVNGTNYKEITYDEMFNDTWEFIYNGKTYDRKTSDAAVELKTLGATVFEKYSNFEKKDVTDDNVAINASLSSTNGADGSHGLENLIDGDTNTLWVAANGNTPSSVTLNLFSTYDVYNIHLDFEKAPAAQRGLFVSFYLEVERNGIWEKVYEGATTKEAQSFDVLFKDMEAIEKVRVTITDIDSPLYPAIAEVKVFSSKGIMSEDLVIDEGMIAINDSLTVAQLKAKLHADAGDIKVYRGEDVLEDEAVLEDGDTLHLEMMGIVLDTVTIKTNAQVIDKSELQHAFDQYKTLEESDYTISTWAIFEAAFDAAKTILNREDVTQNEVNIAKITLEGAAVSLVKKASLSSIQSLAKACDSLEALRDGYSEAEFVEAETAIANAKAILDKEDADTSVTEVMDALIDVVVAKGNLHKNVLLDALQVLVAQADQILDSDEIKDVRPTQVENLRNAVKTAVAFIDANSTDKEAIANAQNNLYKAIQELYKIVNKDILNKAIEAAKKLDQASYTEASWNTLQDALTVAEEIASNEDATSEEVQNAYEKLLSAIASLELGVDKAALNYQLYLANKMLASKDSYVRATIENLQAVVDAANAVYNNAAASQAEINDATNKLITEMAKARLKADKSVLEEAINQAANINLNGVNAKVSADFKVAYLKAQEVFANENATKEEIAAATAALTKAMEQFTVTEKPSNTESATKGASVVNSGDSTTSAGIMALFLFSCVALITLKKRREDTK